MANTVTARQKTNANISGLFYTCRPRGASTSADQSPTGVRGRDDGTEEEAVGVVELVVQLSDHLHQFDHAVHQIPGRGAAGEQVSKNFCEHEATLEKQEAGWTLTQ